MDAGASGHRRGGGDRPVRVEELIALREGELSSEQEKELLERIGTDPDATELLDQLHQTDTILARLRNKPIPPDVTEAIHRRLDDESRRRNHTDEG